MGELVEMAGRRFGRLTVIRRENDGRWKCQCDCGAEKAVRGGNLRRGLTKSCGCYQREQVSKALSGLASKFPNEYVSWTGMIARCKPGGAKRAHYHDRGIAVCERWRDSFAHFLADMGPKPSPAFTIERKNNNEGYSPENCRWATQAEQMRNTTKTVTLTINGRSQTLSEWSRELGVKVGTLSHRKRSGWTDEETLTTHPNLGNRLHTRKDSANGS